MPAGSIGIFQALSKIRHHRALPKFIHIPCQISPCGKSAASEGEFQMRITAAFFGWLSALAVMTTPALAANSNAPQSDEKSVSSPCHTMQRGPDGQWLSIPCQEVGSPAQPQPRRGRATETSHGSE
jgi:hypothetical protein